MIGCVQWNPVYIWKEYAVSRIETLSSALVGHSLTRCSTRCRDYKKIVMLNSAEHDFFPAHKC